MAAFAPACVRREGAPLDTLVVAIESNPINLDPRVGQDQNSWRVHQALYATLVKKGPGGTYVPSLAETMDTEDGSVWRFRLREGLSFHDGRKLTSADVRFTFESLLSEGFASGKKEALRIVDRIETPSPRDVVFHLKTPYASFPLQLLLGILPDGTKTEDARTKPIGAGPYRLVSARPDEAYVFEAWEGFHEGAARLPKLVYKVVPDSTTRALELLRGSLHLAINSLPPDLLPRLAKNPGLAVKVAPGSTYFYLCFNLRDPLLGDVRVRRALALALDREALAHGLFRDTVVPSETLVPPGNWARATPEELPPLRRDLAEARRLLDAAGYPERPGGKPRFSIAYKTSTDETSILQATAIAEQWREIGVECTLRSNDFATFFEDVRKGAFQVFSLRWQGIDDPDHYHDVFLSSAIPPKGANRGFYTNPEADQLIDDARRVLDPGLRRPLYVRLQQRIAQDLPYISLFTSRVVAVHDSRLTGLEALPPSGDFTFLPLVGRR